MSEEVEAAEFWWTQSQRKKEKKKKHNMWYLPISRLWTLPLWKTINYQNLITECGVEKRYVPPTLRSWQKPLPALCFLLVINHAQVGGSCPIWVGIWFFISPTFLVPWHVFISFCPHPTLVYYKHMISSLVQYR